MVILAFPFWLLESSLFDNEKPAPLQSTIHLFVQPLYSCKAVLNLLMSNLHEKILKYQVEYSAYDKLVPFVFI